MNRKFVLLNLVLVALISAFVWVLRIRWIEAKAHERAVFDRAAEQRRLLPPAPLSPPKSVTPVEYVDVAQKDAVREGPESECNPGCAAPPPPPPPMPQLPTYHGQMAIADPVVFLSLPNAPQKRYSVGDKVGPFKVVSFNSEVITLDWDGKKVERRLLDLAPKENSPPQIQPAAAAAAPQTAAPAAKSLSGNATSLSDTVNPALGFETGPGLRACTATDNSPTGTIVDGYKKVLGQSMMGKSCYWEKVK